MTKTIKEISIDNMINEVCKRYGFEARQTISFCRLCERTTNYELIRKKFQKLMGEGLTSSPETDIIQSSKEKE